MTVTRREFITLVSGANGSTDAASASISCPGLTSHQPAFKREIVSTRHWRTVMLA